MLWSSMGKERNGVGSPSEASFSAHQNLYEPEPDSQFAPPRASFASVISIPLCATSTETPWMPSP